MSIHTVELTQDVFVVDVQVPPGEDPILAKARAELAAAKANLEAAKAEALNS